mgnify:FL=1
MVDGNSMTEGEVLVYDDFLDPSSFELLQNTMMDNGKNSMAFPWLWSENPDRALHIYHLYHVFWHNDKVWTHPDYWKIIKPLTKALNCKKIIKIRANLTTRTKDIEEFYMHTDVPSNFKSKTAIYYVNSNDGYTKFEGNKIESVANRMIVFDSNINHTGTTCTNTKRRLVINFNYYESSN